MERIYKLIGVILFMVCLLSAATWWLFDISAGYAVLVGTTALLNLAAIVIIGVVYACTKLDGDEWTTTDSLKAMSLVAICAVADLVVAWLEVYA